MAVFFCAAPSPAFSTEAPAEAALQIVKPGREGLELSARFTADGSRIEHDIDWTIRAADGAEVFSAGTGTADVSVPPGDYIVEAEYGAAEISRSVSIPPGTRLKVNFTLPAGELRVKPEVSGLPVPACASRVRVFALSGKRPGGLVAVSGEPGEVMRLPEGKYRVESRVSVGNVKAVTDVRVTAGRVSDVTIGHKAGLARLNFVGSPNSDVRWEVVDDSGTPVAAKSSLNTNVALLPGTYTAKAEVGAELLTATFSIGAGEIRDIMLGN